MAPGYKDHPIPELIGESTCDDNTYLCPTKAVYEKWLTTVLKVLGALSLFWIIPMALALEYERGQYCTLVDDVPDDTDNMVFQYIVVALAIQHGALLSLPSPMAEFSAQISTKCSTVFSNIFGHQEALTAPHLLTGLRELADIHLTYQCDGAAVNASTVWKENFAAIQRPITPDTHVITDWINTIEKSVQGLTLARVPISAIN
eukprot:1100463-Rhodomonas_salina.1